MTHVNFKPDDCGSGEAVCSSSGGKDSMLALWYAKQRSVQPRTLLTMFDETGLRSRSHGVPRAVVERQARALGLQLLAPSASWTDYEKVFVDALRALRASGHEIAIFGDIDLEAHREWEERVCGHAIVVCVDSRHLGDDIASQRSLRSEPRARAMPAYRTSRSDCASRADAVRLRRSVAQRHDGGRGESAALCCHLAQERAGSCRVSSLPGSLPAHVLRACAHCAFTSLSALQCRA